MYNDFSLSIMKKYGWKEGEGLGKKSQGISKPVRPNLKFNSRGIGFQEVSVDNDSKWSNMYSSALSLLNVDKKDESKINIDTSKQKVSRFGYKSLEEGFQKSDTVFKDGQEVREKSEKEKKKSKKRKCNPNEDKTCDETIEEVLKSKKSKNRKIAKSIDEYSEVSELSVEKKSKKCKDTIIQNKVNNESMTEIKIVKKHKKNKIVLSEEDQLEHNDMSEISVKKSSKKRKSVKSTEDTIDETIEELNNEITSNAIFDVVCSKNKKKKSKNNLLNVDDLILPISSQMTCHQSARFGMGMSGKLARVQRLYETEKLNSSLNK